MQNFNGDGISCQTDYNITIRNCEVLGCTKNGVPPGAGSYHTIVENCNLHHNGADGLFICWRVKKGTFWKNQMHHNGGSGINIGHRDTDNLFDHNQCYDNALAGIHLRPEKPENAPHRCVFTNNVITNNGELGHGCGFLIESDAQDMRFETNIFDESGAGRQITGFLFERPLKGCVMIHNTFLGSMHDKELYLAKTEGNLNEANI